MKDGARLTIGKPAGYVPREGLRLWLTAKKGLRAAPNPNPNPKRSPCTWHG